jgi:hypothetical protein
MRIIAACIASCFTLVACSSHDLRGSAHPSDDGNTYLSVVDDNAGTCTSVQIDGKPWTHKTGEKGQISPGSHMLSCNDGSYAFDVADGQVFEFDYWGP